VIEPAGLRLSMHCFLPAVSLTPWGFHALPIIITIGARIRRYLPPSSTESADGGPPADRDHSLSSREPDRPIDPLNPPTPVTAAGGESPCAILREWDGVILRLRGHPAPIESLFEHCSEGRSLRNGTPSSSRRTDPRLACGHPETRKGSDDLTTWSLIMRPSLLRNRALPFPPAGHAALPFHILRFWLTPRGPQNGPHLSLSS
jgi:hypothetical protein